MRRRSGATRPGVAVLVLAGALAGAPRAGAAEPAAEPGLDRRGHVGGAVEDAELATLDGRRERLLAAGGASVLVFFRPRQERSLDTLKDVAACEKEFAGRPVRFVGLVSDAFPADEVRAFAREAGVGMPILVDAGDALYGRLGVRLHPLIAIVDARRRIAGFEPFRQINYCDRVRVRIRLALGEATAADVARVDEPGRSDTRSEAGVARRHLNFARHLHAVGDEPRALEEVKKSLAFAPGAEAYALQGAILAALGRCPEARRAFDAAARLDPASVAAADRRSCTP